MKSQRIQLKLYLDGTCSAEKLVSVFHKFVQTGELTDQARNWPELLIDVIEYGHVHEGPLVLLVGHESDYLLDNSEGRLGLTYQRKRAVDPGEAQRLTDSAARLLRLARLLVAEPELEGLRVRTDELRLQVTDRLAVPNDAASYEENRAELEAFASKLFGGTVSYEPSDPRGPFAVRMRGTSGRTLSDLETALD